MENKRKMISIDLATNEVLTEQAARVGISKVAVIKILAGKLRQGTISIL